MLYKLYYLCINRVNVILGNAHNRKIVITNLIMLYNLPTLCIKNLNCYKYTIVTVTLVP